MLRVCTSNFFCRSRRLIVAMAMWCSERVYVTVLCGVPPTDEEWDRWIELILRRKGHDVRVLVEAHDTGPDAKQRKTISDALKGEDLRAAVMTESTIARGIVTALAWLGVPQRAFGVNQYAQAANYLELTHAELEQILEVLPRLRRESGLQTAIGA
jgi:hypothetical protein